MIYGIGANLTLGPNVFFSFWAPNPSDLDNYNVITGLQPNELMRGIDFWAGQLYGVTDAGRLYTISTNAGTFGQASLVSASPVPAFTSAYQGADNISGGMLVTSIDGQMQLLDRSNGSLVPGPSATSPAGIASLAYNFANGVVYAMRPASFVGGPFAELGTLDPATGAYTAIGFMNIAAARNNGFDVSQSNGILYLGVGATSSSMYPSLYTVNPGTAAVVSYGTIGNVDIEDGLIIRGMAVVPEPSTFAMLGLGGLGLLAFVMRRRA